MTATPSILIRHAGPADRERLELLAELDSAAPLAGDAVLAEVDGVLRAAVSLADGRAIADPFAATAELVELLRSHAAASGARAPRRRLGLLRPALGV
jgi:hypothetical protein